MTPNRFLYLQRQCPWHLHLHIERFIQIPLWSARVYNSWFILYRQHLVRNGIRRATQINKSDQSEAQKQFLSTEDVHTTLKKERLAKHLVNGRTTCIKSAGNKSFKFLHPHYHNKLEINLTYHPRKKCDERNTKNWNMLLCCHVVVMQLLIWAWLLSTFSWVKNTWKMATFVLFFGPHRCKRLLMVLSVSPDLCHGARPWDEDRPSSLNGIK